MNDSNRTCLANGNWSGTVPICSPECSEITHLENGYVLQYDYSAIFYCDNGYTLEGSYKLDCLADGSWSDSMPTCKIVCPVIQDTSLYLVFSPPFFFQPFHYETVVTFKCLGEYDLVGNEILMCMISGEWNGTIPTCATNTLSTIESNISITTSTQITTSTHITTTSIQVTTSHPSYPITTSSLPRPPINTRCSSLACTESSSTAINDPSVLFNVGKTPTAIDLPNVLGQNKTFSIINIVIIASVAIIVPIALTICAMLTICLCILQRRRQKRKLKTEVEGEVYKMVDYF